MYTYIAAQTMLFAGTVGAFWSLTKEVLDSNPFAVITNILSLN